MKSELDAKSRCRVCTAATVNHLGIEKTVVS